MRTIVAISVIVDWHYTGADKEPKDGCAGFIGQQAMDFSLGLNIFGFILLFISRKSIGRLKVGLIPTALIIDLYPISFGD